MNFPIYLTKNLTLINIAVVILFLLGITVLRERRSEIAVEKQNLIYQPETFHREIKLQESDLQRKIQENQEKIQNYQQELQQTQNQLEAYKIQNAKLKQVNRLQQKASNSASSRLTSQPTALSPSSSPAFAVRSIAAHHNTASSPQKTARYLPSPYPKHSSQQPPSSLSEMRLAIKPINPQGKNKQDLLAIKSPQAGNSSQIEGDRETSIRYANDLTSGLVIADKQGQIKYGTKTYRQVQSAIRLLRRGHSLEEAARRAKVSPSVLRQLIAWGENRPGSLTAINRPFQKSELKKPEGKGQTSIRYANDVTAGLLIADKQGQIEYGTKTYRQVQSAIRLLRRGYSLEESARQAKVSPSVLKQLIEWGGIRPGSLIDLNSEISLASPKEAL